MVGHSAICTQQGYGCSIGKFTKLGRLIGHSAALGEHSASWATEPMLWVLGWLDS
jgi:hypothetical protein